MSCKLQSMGLLPFGTENGLYIAAMPSVTRCVHCGVVGYVRWERVITGTLTVVEYYCGNCEHVWRQREDEERREQPRAAPVTDRPDRSRSAGLPKQGDERARRERRDA